MYEVSGVEPRLADFAGSEAGILTLRSVTAGILHKGLCRFLSNRYGTDGASCSDCLVDDDTALPREGWIEPGNSLTSYGSPTSKLTSEDGFLECKVRLWALKSGIPV
ncbi:hypothetical protein V1477_012018 [Vespula maculifrons]|uniref:Uncharacterized protein n=3 Tax=Vespula TaxID=7451 RepID=A0A834NJY7_VESPE|nr:hypothetical protein HZH66_011040 [Vespula vulgaris]KAF7410614.1 hypothetical protein H0235_013221 [Vespula pensylvanica]